MSFSTFQERTRVFPQTSLDRHAMYDINYSFVLFYLCFPRFLYKSDLPVMLSSLLILLLLS